MPGRFRHRISPQVARKLCQAHMILCDTTRLYACLAEKTCAAQGLFPHLWSNLMAVSAQRCLSRQNPARSFVLLGVSVIGSTSLPSSMLCPI